MAAAGGAAHLRINADRLHQALAGLARVGAAPRGGVSRLALTDADGEGRDILKGWMEEAGLQVRIDDFGNMTGRRPGYDPDALPVIMGSHCDSVLRGGRYDGALGVVGALEVVRTLNDAGITTRCPIEVVNWTNEEGARFQPAMLGSGAVAGAFSKEYVYSRTDNEGHTFADELRRIGYMGDEQNRPGPARAFLELHIEQGPVLDDLGIPVGVVEGISGITWCRLVVEGRANHAGSTPMGRRSDAMAAAAAIITGLSPRGGSWPWGPGVATVGHMKLDPNIINVIPDRAEFTVDMRHPDMDTLGEMFDGLERMAREAAAHTHTRVSVDRFWTSEATAFDGSLVDRVEEVVGSLGLPVLRLWSGPGHDAKYMADLYPTAMIFVRSRGGVSHSEDEYSRPEDVEAGVNVLLHTALGVANAQK